MNKFKRIVCLVLITFIAIPAFCYNKNDLYKAVSSNSLKMVKKILTQNPNLTNLRYDKENNTILMHAINRKANKDIISALLLAGCSVDAKNKSGQTALMLACENLNDKKLINRIIFF